MTEQQTKRWFFIAGDVVKHKKTGLFYIVAPRYIDGGEREQVFYDLFDVRVKSMGNDFGVETEQPFNELEMVEPIGEYMGNPTPVKTGQDLAKEWGLDKLDIPTSNDFEIKSRLSRIEESIRELRAYLEDAKILK